MTDSPFSCVCPSLTNFFVGNGKQRLRGRVSRGKGEVTDVLKGGGNKHYAGSGGVMARLSIKSDFAKIDNG